MSYENKLSGEILPCGPSAPVKVVRRNNRERSRIGVINSTFQRLRQFFPRKKDDRRMSKLEILQRAINYIQDLSETITTEEFVSPTKLVNAPPPKRPRAKRSRKTTKQLFNNENSTEKTLQNSMSELEMRADSSIPYYDSTNANLYYQYQQQSKNHLQHCVSQENYHYNSYSSLYSGQHTCSPSNSMSDGGSVTSYSGSICQAHTFTENIPPSAEQYSDEQILDDLNSVFTYEYDPLYQY